jgi:hypothetical protein
VCVCVCVCGGVCACVCGVVRVCVCVQWTAMHLAAVNDQAPTLELLHEYGAQLDLRDASGRTPIRLGM